MKGFFHPRHNELVKSRLQVSYWCLREGAGKDTGIMIGVCMGNLEALL